MNMELELAILEYTPGSEYITVGLVEQNPALHRLQVLENPVLLHLIRVFSVDLTALQPPALLEGACQGMFRALFAEAARRMDSFKPREMQSLSLLCAQPLGLENAGDMSAGDLRSCCFALATTGGPAHQPLTLLDQFLEEDQEIFWDPDPVEAPVARRAPASGSVNFQPTMPASVPFVQPMVNWTPVNAPGMAAPCQGPAMSGWSQSGFQVFGLQETPLKLRRESSCSVSSDGWVGGLRSCASDPSDLSSLSGKGKGKGKGKVAKGWHHPPNQAGSFADSSVSSESENDVKSQLTSEKLVTTSLEVPLSFLRSSWKSAVSEASTARIEVDASRREGFGRLIMVGSWRQSLLAYQCLMKLFGQVRKDQNDRLDAPKIRMPVNPPVPVSGPNGLGPGMPGFSSDNIFLGGYPPQQDGINHFGLGAEAPMQANMERQRAPDRLDHGIGGTERQMATNSTERLEQQALLQTEVERMMTAYDSFSYGPFHVCYGDLSSSGTFECRNDLLNLNYTSKFSTPQRKASIREYSQEAIQVSFNLVVPKQEESAAGMGLLCFVVLVMCIFGLLMSQSISQVALLPLERMLSVVRQRCQQIFKYTTDLKDEEESEDEDDDDQELEQSSEFMLLEKVVKKLAAIAHLSSVAGEPEVKDNMTENEIMTLNWLQGASVANGRKMMEGEDEKSTLAVPTPRGKEGLSAITGKIPANTLEELNTPDFNALSQTVELKIAIGTYVVWVHEGCLAWVRDNVPENTLFKFMTAVEAKYPSENPFHNFSHGLDVLYNVSRFCRLANLQSTFTETSQFWLLIAASGHDLGHLGVNNQFLVETTHEVAVKYNDRSPLENLHCATLFQITNSSPDTNVFSNVDKDTYKEMRKGIIAAILHTDMVKHNEMIKELSLLYQMNSDALDSLKADGVVKSSAATTQTLMNALLHCADIGNPMKPWDLCYELAHLCLDEFFAQGDMEKERGIPVQMLNDREKVNRPNSQVGFIEFVICPMAESICNIFPQLDNLAHHLGINVQNWLQLWIDEASPPEEQTSKVSERVRRVVLRLKECTSIWIVEDPAVYARSPGKSATSQLTRSCSAECSLMPLASRTSWCGCRQAERPWCKKAAE
eukprot:s1357_g3.t3